MNRKSEPAVVTRGLAITLLLAVLALAPASVTWGQAGVTAPLDPRGTFLRTDSNDTPSPPIILNLAATWFAPGDWLEITYDFPPPGFSWGGPCDDANVPLPEDLNLLAVFSGSETLLATSELHRVQDAIDTGSDFPSIATYGGLPTDIPEDFRVFPSSSFIIASPTGATHLFVGVHDSAYYDNCVDGNRDIYDPVGAIIVTVETWALEVGIDIKPGSEPNCFNNNGHGVIPVAILGSESFDVLNIDTATLLFDGLDVRVRGNRGPQCSFEDSDLDGETDLVCHFEDESDNWTAGDSVALLTGELFDGTSIAGTDSICIVP